MFVDHFVYQTYQIALGAAPALAVTGILVNITSKLTLLTFIYNICILKSFSSYSAVYSGILIRHGSSSMGYNVRGIYLFVSTNNISHILEVQSWPIYSLMGQFGICFISKRSNMYKKIATNKTCRIGQKCILTA